MKVNELQDLLEKNKTEDGYNLEAINEAINNGINDVVVKKTEEARDKAVLDFFKDLGVENKDDLKSKLENTDKLAQALEDKEKSVAELNEKATKLEQINKVRALGINDEDTLDYVIYNASKRVNDEVDFDKALETFKADKPQYFETKPNNEPITTGTKVDNSNEPTVYGFEKILQEKHPDLKK